MTEHCDDCVKGDFGTIKKLVFFILTVVVLSGGLTSWVTIAKSDEDHNQNIRLVKVEKDIEVIAESMDKLVSKLDKLTDAQMEELKERKKDRKEDKDEDDD